MSFKLWHVELSRNMFLDTHVVLLLDRTSCRKHYLSAHCDLLSAMAMLIRCTCSSLGPFSDFR